MQSGMVLRIAGLTSSFAGTAPRIVRSAKTVIADSQSFDCLTLFVGVQILVGLTMVKVMVSLTRAQVVPPFDEVVVVCWP